MPLDRKLRLFAYACLVLLGTLGPWYFNLQFMAEHASFDLAAFLTAAFANPAAGSLSMDILIAAPAGMLFFVPEARRLGMRHVWVYFVVSCTVAFAAGFPLFLLVRELKMHAQQAPPRRVNPAGAPA